MNNLSVPVRWLNLKEVMEHCRLGRNAALELGEVSGAKRKIKGRVVYDIAILDEYISRQVPVSNELSDNNTKTIEEAAE